MTHIKLTCSPVHACRELLPSYFQALRDGLSIDTANSPMTPVGIESEIAAIIDDPDGFIQYMEDIGAVFLVQTHEYLDGYFEEVVGVFKQSRRRGDEAPSEEVLKDGDYGWSITPKEQGKGHGRTVVYGSLLSAVMMNLSEFYLTADGDEAAEFIEYMFPSALMDFSTSEVDDRVIPRYRYVIDTAEAVDDFCQKYGELGEQLQDDIDMNNSIKRIAKVLKEAA